MEGLLQKRDNPSKVKERATVTQQWVTTTV
jgi:hypothetical protein